MLSNKLIICSLYILIIRNLINLISFVNTCVLIQKSLNFFLKDESDLDGGVPVVRVTRATPVLPPGVTDDTPDLNRQEVSLDISPELFGNSASITLTISEIFGNLIHVSSWLLDFLFSFLFSKMCVRTHNKSILRF